MQHYFKKSEIHNNFQLYSWEYIVFNEFETMLTSKARLFPCIFGIAGFLLDQLRYSFNERMTASEIAPALEHFVKHSREYGQKTSLVIFSRPSPVEDITRYEKRFWSLLSELALIDKHNWPEQIPPTMDDPLWEFCFAGEPIFVVCNTPAHVLRQSRRASSFMLTFQPRWVFEEILGTPESAKRSLDKVRTRLKLFDLIPHSPHLGLYGNPQNREYAQYFLRENNNKVSCPFHQLTYPSSKNKDVA